MAARACSECNVRESWLTVSAVIALLPGAAYWIAVFIGGLYERDNSAWTNRILLILPSILPASFLMCLIATFMAGFGIWRQPRARSVPAFGRVFLWILSAGSYAVIPLHFFRAAGAGL